jgi:hypothetical protein
VGSKFLLLASFCLLPAFCPSAIAQSGKSAPAIPVYANKNFDYAEFTRFDAAAAPKDGIYQTNGFMALRESGFGGQIIVIPAPVDPTPRNTSDRLLAAEISAPQFVDAAGRSYDFGTSPATRGISYYADRTVYRAAFDGGPSVSFTVYPIYGKSSAALKIKIEKSDGALAVTLPIKGTGLPLLPGQNDGIERYGSPRWPYRLLIGVHPSSAEPTSDAQWKLAVGEEAAAVIATGGTEDDAKSALSATLASPDFLAKATHDAWNAYLASAPLVIPADPVHFTIATTGEQRAISPDDLVRSELWFWRGVLTTTCQVSYLPATPVMIADWNVFMGMWSNDGVSEALAISTTSRRDIGRGAILNWFRYSVNSKGDGSTAWTIFPSGRNTFQATGRERDTQGVPLQAWVVGQYVRQTGDVAILDEKLGGLAGDRTLWQALLAYQKNLLAVRDTNHDHLIDWLHTYETGWDDKDSPFIDAQRSPTSTINEQVFNLWSLEEMAYLSRLRGEDPSPWLQEFALAEKAVREKMWDPATQRYWDLDDATGKLWTQGENLDAYYFLYFETDPARIAAMMKRLNDPAKFNGALLPTLAFDTPKWGGYWRGPSWPREYSYVTLGLAQAGLRQEAFDWLARAINTNIGPILPETINPRTYPGTEDISGVRIMGYDALDTAAFPDVAGLRIWAGQDLTVAPDPSLGTVYVHNQKWMGDSYDALFAPNHPTQLWRNGKKLKSLPSNQIWRATMVGNRVTFAQVPAAPAAGAPPN